MRHIVRRAMDGRRVDRDEPVSLPRIPRALDGRSAITTTLYQRVDRRLLTR
jgi:hypothetical protein